MNRTHRVFIGTAVLVIAALGGFALLNTGVYGLTIFVVYPVLLGAISSWILRPATAGRAIRIGTITILISMEALLLLRAEGFICILMALPLAVPLGILGSLLVYRLSSYRQLPQAAALLMLLPCASLTWDMTSRPVVFKVHSQIEIAAPPERVWKHVIAFSPLPEPRDWVFRAGIAYPMRARIEGSGPGAVRYCEFSTGPFVEPIEVWDEPHLLQFRVTHNPAPMHEWSPYAEVLPRHLQGYLVSKRGEFRLTRLGPNRTLLEGNTWYQHGLWPGEYWRWWSDAIIHRIHLRVLGHIRDLAEAPAA